MSRNNKNLKNAYDKGYRMSKCGKFIIYKGEIRYVKYINNQGYYSFNNRIGKDTTPVNCHRLQAFQKFGDDIFKEGIVVRHKNNNPLDNSWENISIGTHSDNMFDKPKELRMEIAVNATRANQNSIRSEEDRFMIYSELLKGVPYNKISLDHNISKGTLSYMKNNSLEYKEFCNKNKF